MCAIIKEMPTIKYRIQLTDKEKKLKALVSKGASPARTIMRANILLASDRNGKKPMKVEEVSKAFHVSPSTIQKVRAGFSENGLELTVTRKKQSTSPVAAKVTEKVEAHIIVLACSKTPKGYDRWAVRLLADK